MSLDISGVDATEAFLDMKRRSKDVAYFERNYIILKAQFPDEWVAIIRESIRGHDKSYKELVRKLGEQAPLAYIQKTYVTEEVPTLILPFAD